MKRILLVATLVFVVAIGLYLWLRDGTEQTSPLASSDAQTPLGTTPTSSPDSPVRRAASTGSASTQSDVTAGSATKDARSFNAMDQTGKARVEATVIKLSGVNTEFGDLYALAKAEAADPKWSAATESAIDVALRAGGAGYSGLQVGAPHCSATVCVVEAAAIGGTNSQGSPSDWQTLIGSVYAEPWFAENFVDARVVMADDATGTVYISVFERKP